MRTNVATHTVKLLYVVHHNLVTLKLRRKTYSAHSKKDYYGHKQRQRTGEYTLQLIHFRFLSLLTDKNTKNFGEFLDSITKIAYLC
jgi:hypothetical protein